MTFFEAIDPVFNSQVLDNALLKKLATGFDWVERPVWFGDKNCLLSSDIPNNHIMRWSGYRRQHFANAAQRRHDFGRTADLGRSRQGDAAFAKRDRSGAVPLGSFLLFAAMITKVGLGPEADSWITRWSAGFSAKRLLH